MDTKKTKVKQDLNSRADQIRPTGNKLLVKQHEDYEQTEGGIFLTADAYRTQTRKGTVLRAGKDATLTKGQVIHYPQFAGHIIGERLKLIYETDVALVEC